MDIRQELLVEGRLFKEVRAFLECIEDKEQRQKMVKKAILEFNEEFGTTVDEVIPKLKKMLSEQCTEKLDTVNFQEDDERDF